MPVTANGPSCLGHAVAIAPSRLKPNRFSHSIYGDPAAEIDDLLQSIRDHGILVALVVAPEPGTRILGGRFRTPPSGMCTGSRSDESPLRGSPIPQLTRHAVWRFWNITVSAKNLQSTNAGSRCA